MRARIRTVKPEFYNDGKLGRLGHTTRDFFRSSWTFCCDQGHHPLDPDELSIKVYPYDNEMDGKKVAGMIHDLVTARRYVLYEAGGSHYLYIPTWLRHQKINRPTECNHPEPSQSNIITDTKDIKAALDKSLVVKPVASTPRPAKIQPRNEHKDRESAQRILEYLNDKCGRGFSVTSETNTGLVTYHLAKGYTEEDFCLVVDVKKAEFLKKKGMKDYLRPSTLFGKENFPIYVEQARETGERPTAADEAARLLEDQ